MMHVDLVDMVDFVKKLCELGIKCVSNETESVKKSIGEWFNRVDSESNSRFWETLLRIEKDGILLPDVEEVIDWSHRQLPH